MHHIIVTMVTPTPDILLLLLWLHLPHRHSLLLLLWLHLPYRQFIIVTMSTPT